jgi:DNA-binding IclR family transcriptional regulator
MTIAAVARCLNVIETLASAPTGLALGDLADRLAVPKSAAFRLLHALVDRGYVDQDADSLDYRLSLKVATLGFRYLDSARLPDPAQVALDTLAARTAEYCRMALVDGDGLVWVARAQGATQGLRYDPPMGRDVVLHATATGKAWLATLDEDEAVRLVLARGLEPRPGQGPLAVRTLDDLRRQLAATRDRGYALAIEEGEPGTVAIAAAFRQRDGDDAPVAGTISVAGPQVRLTEGRVAELAAIVVAAARDITRWWPVRQRTRAASASRRDG